MSADPIDVLNEQSRAIQTELLQVYQRLLDEGVAPGLLLGSVGASAAGLVQALKGPGAVPEWFARWAVMAKDWGKIGGN
jgi:hypothetical protein